jgi:hypothetical protein
MSRTQQKLFNPEIRSNSLTLAESGIKVDQTIEATFINIQNAITKFCEDNNYNQSQFQSSKAFELTDQIADLTQNIITINDLKELFKLCTKLQKELESDKLFDLKTGKVQINLNQFHPEVEIPNVKKNLLQKLTLPEKLIGGIFATTLGILAITAFRSIPDLSAKSLAKERPPINLNSKINETIQLTEPKNKQIPAIQNSSPAETNSNNPSQKPNPNSTEYVQRILSTPPQKDFGNKTERTPADAVVELAKASFSEDYSFQSPQGNRFRIKTP